MDAGDKSGRRQAQQAIQCLNRDLSWVGDRLRYTHMGMVKQTMQTAWNRMFRSFVFVWIGYAILVAAFPGTMSSGSLIGGILIQAVFVAAVAIAMYSLRLSKNESQRIEISLAGATGIGHGAWVGLCLGALGTGCMLYDRTIVQQVDFNMGLASVRNSLNDNGLNRSFSVSSPASVLGHLLGGCHFVAAVLVIRRIHGRATTRQVLVLCVCSALVLLGSAVNGGRSGLMLYFAVCLPAFFLNPRASIVRLMTSPIVLSLLALFIVYSIGIFISRSTLSQTTEQEYLIAFLTYLNIEPWPWLSSVSLPSVFCMPILAWAYCVHSFTTTCCIAVEPNSENLMIGNHIMALFSKAGFIDAFDSDWFLFGRFPSLPGALYHQFGTSGLVGFSLLLGAVASTTLRIVAFFSRSMIALGAFVLCAVILVLSPELPAFDVLAFPSVAVGFLILAPFENLTNSPWSPRRISIGTTHA